MRYCIISDNIIKYEYSTLEQAKQKLNKLNEKKSKENDKSNKATKSNKANKANKIKKNQSKNYKIVKIPEFKIGLKLYRKLDDDSIKYLGEIVQDAGCLWFSKKYEKQNILNPWLKDSFEDKYIKGLLVVGDNE
jgi:hypothetical protein